MASDFDLEDGLEVFQASCEVPRNVLIGLLVDGEDRLEGSMTISSYMLQEVGL